MCFGLKELFSRALNHHFLTSSQKKKCGKCSKNLNRKEYYSFEFIFEQKKEREVTSFAKGGNSIASLCKTGYFSQRIPPQSQYLFFFWGGGGGVGGWGGGGGVAGIKVVLFKFLEPLLYSGMSLKLSDLIFVKVRKQALVAIPYTLSIRAPYLLTLTFPKI